MLKSKRRGAAFADRSESGDDLGGVYGEQYCCCGWKKELASIILSDVFGGVIVTKEGDVRIGACCGVLRRS
jgi:hypothetical protein